VRGGNDALGKEFGLFWLIEMIRLEVLGSGEASMSEFGRVDWHWTDGE
jgi:hypothetical protein